MTTARYYTPNGRSIQAECITPDLVVKFVAPVEAKAAPEGAQHSEGGTRERDLKGHIKSATENEPSTEGKTDAKAAAEPNETARDNQLKSAIDILKSWDIFKKTSKS